MIGAKTLVTLTLLGDRSRRGVRVRRARARAPGEPRLLDAVSDRLLRRRRRHADVPLLAPRRAERPLLSLDDRHDAVERDARGALPRQRAAAHRARRQPRRGVRPRPAPAPVGVHRHRAAARARLHRRARARPARPLPAQRRRNRRQLLPGAGRVAAGERRSERARLRAHPPRLRARLRQDARPVRAARSARVGERGVHAAAARRAGAALRVAPARRVRGTGCARTRRRRTSPGSSATFANAIAHARLARQRATADAGVGAARVAPHLDQSARSGRRRLRRADVRRSLSLARASARRRRRATSARARCSSTCRRSSCSRRATSRPPALPRVSRALGRAARRVRASWRPIPRRRSTAARRARTSTPCSSGSACSAEQQGRRTTFLSFQCYFETDGAAPKSTPFTFAGHHFTVEEVRVPPSAPDASLYVDRYDAVAQAVRARLSLRRPPERRGHRARRGDGPSSRVRGTRLSAHARCYGLDSLDIYLDPGWIAARPDLLEVYPYERHLKNYVQIFRRQYRARARSAMTRVLWLALVVVVAAPAQADETPSRRSARKRRSRARSRRCARRRRRRSSSRRITRTCWRAAPAPPASSACRSNA